MQTEIKDETRRNGSQEIAYIPGFDIRENLRSTKNTTARITGSSAVFWINISTLKTYLIGKLVKIDIFEIHIS